MPDNRSGQRGGSGNRWGGGHRGRGDNRGRGQYQGGENRGGQYQRGDNRGRGNQPRGRGGDRGGGTCNPPIRDASRGNYREGSRGRGPSAFRGRESSRGGDRGSRRGGDRGGDRGGGQEDHGRIYNPGETPPYDAEVSQKENEIENSVLNPGNPTGKAAASPSTNTLPLRPGYNTQGHGILLYANYMGLAVERDLKFFRYSIDIGPGDDKKAPSIKRCKRLVQLLLERHFASERSYIATDSRANIVASKKLAKIPHDLESFEVQDDTDYNKDKHTITIKFAGMIAFSDLIDYLTSSNKSASCRNKSQLLQALNIVVGEYPKSRSKIASIGANKHFSLNPGAGDHFSLGEGLEVIRGYFVSVRAATARLLVNVQVKNVAVYEGGSLRDLIKKRISNYEDLEKLKNLEKFLKTSRVVVTYLKKDGKLIPRQKTIKGLADPDDAKGQGERLQVKKFGAGPGDVSFWAKKEGWMTASGWVTVANWFKNKHGIDVNLNLPVINVGSKAKPSYVPADVCEVIARQPAKMKLSAKQTANMIKFAVRSPDANADSIVNQGAPLLGFSSTNSVLETFGLTPDPKLITVPGQVLPAPSLTYKGKSINPTDASWNLSSLVFYETRSALTRWTWVILGSDSTASGHNAILERIKTWAMNTSTVGIQINVQSDVPGVTVPFCGNKQQDMEDMDDAFRHLATQRLDFILVVLPSRDTSLYNTVKYLCDVKYGLLHACVVANKFNQDLRKAAQYDGNVALKVNLKLGGTNHQVGDNQLGIVSQGETMLVGIDVTHPSPGSTENAPSIAAIVASVDSKLSQFPAQLLVQKGKQERVEGLGDLLESRLRIWKDKNGVYPENIIVYRDGVSEGQYDMVVADELPELQRACRKLCGKQKKPRISIVIVGKRHHTRFYVTEESDASKSKNPPNGTVVDRGVTEARTFDFFLQSHAALHGTARPAHYIVVHDEIFSGMKNLGPRFRNPAEVLIDLSHRLCYTYGRATKAVSICPPAYYADLACERARCYLQDYFDPHGTSSDAASPDTDKQKQMVKIHDKVKDSMFYI